MEGIVDMKDKSNKMNQKIKSLFEEVRKDILKGCTQGARTAK